MKNLFILIFTLFSHFVFGQCMIDSLIIERLPCNNDGLFSVSINFSHTQSPTAQFRVQGNGSNHGTFNYGSLPIVITDLPGNCITSYEFVVIDMANGDCREAKGIGKVCCSEKCAVTIDNFTTGPCLNNRFNAELKVSHANSGLLGYDVFFNGEFHSFQFYSSNSIVLENIKSVPNTENQVVVCDNDNLLCCDTLFFQSPCACSIGNARYRITQCNQADSSYYITMSFDRQVTSDSFELGGAGTFFGTYAYNQLPITIGPIAMDTLENYLLILDKRNPLCFGELVIAPYQTCDTMCRISNMQARAGECNDDGQFYVNLSFEANNPGLKGFRVRGNGRIYADSLAYGQTSYRIGPLRGDCQTLYEFVVIDRQIEECREDVALTEPVCCGGCELTNVLISPLCETGNLEGIVVDFDLTGGVMGQVVSIRINDTIIAINPANTPFEIPLEILPDTYNYLIGVLGTTCVEEGQVALTCINNCERFRDVKTETSECDDTGKYRLAIEFFTSAPSTDFFAVVLGGSVLGPFQYGQDRYVFEGLPSNCDSVAFSLLDVNVGNCAYVGRYLSPCCDSCMIQDIDLETRCDGDTVFVRVAAKNSVGSNYFVKIGDRRYGPFNYQSPGNFATQLANGTYNATLIDSSNEDCRTNVEFTVSCNNEPCRLSALSAQAVACTEDEFEFEISFDHNRANNDLFELFINGSFLGTSSYSLLPINTPRLKRNAGGPWKILIKDAALTECGVDTIINEEVCVSSTWSLAENVKWYREDATLTIDAGSQKVRHITVCDIVGRVVYENKSLTSNIHTITLPNSTLYFVTLTLYDGRLFTLRCY